MGLTLSSATFCTKAVGLYGCVQESDADGKVARDSSSLGFCHVYITWQKGL